MDSLDALAVKYGTDKGSTDHNYCPHYEQYLAKWREDKIRLLELGIWKGASLYMWRAYFPNATIVGLDRVLRPSNEMQRANITTWQAEQTDDRTISELAGIDGPFDVIIDDASHISSKTIASFRLLWPHLNPGGVYVIEDLQTSYDTENYGENEAKANPNISGSYEWTAMEFCKRLADEVNSSLFPEQYRLGCTVESVQFFPNICFMVKGRRYEDAGRDTVSHAGAGSGAPGAGGHRRHS
jgi:hypothetical protein